MRDPCRTCSLIFADDKSPLALLALLVVVLLSAHVSYADTTQVLTLEKVVSDVLRHNDRVAAANYMAESARRKIGSAGAWKDPMLMVGIQNAPTDFNLSMEPMTMKMLGLSQEIPYSGYKGLARDAARADADAEAANAEMTVIDLVSAGEMAFYELHFLSESFKDLESQRELMSELVDATMTKLRANQTSQEEVLSAQASLWRLETAILSAEQAIIEARSRMNSLRGTGDNKTVMRTDVPPTPDIPLSSDEWVKLATEHYPALQKLRHQERSYSASASSMRRMQWPMLALEFSYGIRSGYNAIGDGMTEKRGDMISLGATISLPLFEGRQQREMARSMDAMRLSVGSEEEQLLHEITLQIKSLHERALRLRENLFSYRDRIVPTSEDAYRSALSSYVNDRTSYSDLLEYATQVYRDRITTNETSLELGRTLIEIERFTTDAKLLLKKYSVTQESESR